MYGFIAPDAMSNRHDEPMQDWVLFIYRVARVSRFGNTKHSRASAHRRAGRLAANSGRRNFDYGIFSDALQFPSRIKSADKGTVAIDSDIHRRTDRCAVTTIRGEQNRSLIHKLIESTWHL
jgi:hypothetical protein